MLKIGAGARGRLNQINKGGLGRTKGKPNPGRCGFASHAALPTGLSPEASPVGSLTAYQQRFAEALHLFAFPLFLGLLLHTPGPLRVRRLKRNRKLRASEGQVPA